MTEPADRDDFTDQEKRDSMALAYQEGLVTDSALVFMDTETTGLSLTSVGLHQVSTFELTCICGWSIKTSDRDTMLHASTLHDKECPGEPVQDKRPHSRACGIRKHEHGPDCHPNCPTCEGKR